MDKFFSAVLVLVFLLIVPVSTYAIEFPSFGNLLFPSFRTFPFPSDDPEPSATPDPSPSATPLPSPVTVLEITDVDPSSANFMQEFVLTGTNFGSTPGGVNFRAYNQSFSLGGAPIVSWSNTEIKAKVPAVKKGSYRIQVITVDNKKSNEVRFVVKNGEPYINSTSLKYTNGEYELTFQGREFGRRGSIDIYSGPDFVGYGIISYWSSSKVRFSPPDLPGQEYGFQITTADGRKSSFKFFTVGN